MAMAWMPSRVRLSKTAPRRVFDHEEAAGAIESLNVNLDSVASGPSRPSVIWPCMVRRAGRITTLPFSSLRMLRAGLAGSFFYSTGINETE